MDKTFKIEINSNDDFNRIVKSVPFIKISNVISLNPNKKQVTISVNNKHMNEFVNVLSNYHLKFFSEKKVTLEDYFMKFYDRTSTDEGGAK